MPKNTLTDLQNHLFAALEGLADKSLDLDRADAISRVASRVIDAAKVEVKFLEVTGAQPGTDFFLGRALPSGQKRNGKLLTS